jgi:putative ABC transport system permease protein
MILGLALKSLRHRRLRTVVTALGIAFAIGIFTLATSAMTLFNLPARMAAQALLQVRPLTRGGFFPLAYVDQVRSVPGAVPAAWQLVAGVNTDAPDGTKHQFIVVGAAPDGDPGQANSWFDAVGSDFFTTTPDQVEAWRHERQGAIVGPVTLAKMKWKIGDLVTVNAKLGFTATGPVFPVPMKIVAVSTGGLRDSSVIVHYDYLDEIFKTRQVEFFFVKCTKSPKECSDMATAIDEFFLNAPLASQTTPWTLILGAVLKRVAVIPDFIVKVGILIMLVTALISASTLSMSLRERTKQLGTLRALGYRRGHIFRLIVSESLAMSLAGGVIGAVLPWVIFGQKGFRITASAFYQYSCSLSIAWTNCVLGILGAVLLGVVVAVLPALRVVRQDVIAAMTGN